MRISFGCNEWLPSSILPNQRASIVQQLVETLGTEEGVQSWLHQYRSQWNWTPDANTRTGKIRMKRQRHIFVLVTRKKYTQGQKCTPVIWPIRLKDHTLCGGTYLYRGVAPGQGNRTLSRWNEFLASPRMSRICVCVFENCVRVYCASILPPKGNLVFPQGRCSPQQMLSWWRHASTWLWQPLVCGPANSSLLLLEIGAEDKSYSNGRWHQRAYSPNWSRYHSWDTLGEFGQQSYM